MDNYFSSNLKFLREQNKVSQEKIAKIVGKKRTLISMWESEKRDPIVEDVMKIAAYFHVGIADLISKDMSAKQTNNMVLNEKELLKKVLIEKGFMNEGDEDISDENFDKLMEIAKTLLK